MNKIEQEILINLSTRLKELRVDKKLSQEKLAEKCGLDRTYISLLERAKRNPSLFNLKKITEGLEISLSDLLKDI